MQIKQVLQQSAITRLEAEILLADVLQVNRTYLHTHPDYCLNAAEQNTFQQKLTRRQQGEPIAYIIQKREFWSLELKVTAATLIPRPETELLVEMVLAHLPATLSHPILELGTGTGAISIALAKERPGWSIIATDISVEALEIAQENAQKHQVNNIHFYQSNWYHDLTKQRFAAIISNPPYIAEADRHLQQGDLPFEPQIALVAGPDGLAAFSQIIANAPQYLVSQGWLFLEHGFNQHFQVQALLQANNFNRIETKTDLNNLPRITYARY